MDECNRIVLSADGSMYLLMTPSNDIETRETERQYKVSNEYIQERNAKAKLPLIQEMSSRNDENRSSWPVKT
jgi:molybdenum cofactor biosynthesis enzyme MoaA